MTALTRKNVLNAVVNGTGPTELGREFALKALEVELVDGIPDYETALEEWVEATSNGFLALLRIAGEREVTRDKRRPFSDWRHLGGSAGWKDLLQFHEHFHGDTGRGLGASHQTGWTALVAKLLEDQARGPRRDS